MDIQQGNTEWNGQPCRQIWRIYRLHGRRYGSRWRFRNESSIASKRAFGQITRHAFVWAIIIHSATGAALGGMRPLAEIQFGGFAALAMNPLINNAANLDGDGEPKSHLRSGFHRAKTRSGPFHANMIESWFANTWFGNYSLYSQDAYDLLVESHL